MKFIGFLLIEFCDGTKHVAFIGSGDLAHIVCISLKNVSDLGLLFRRQGHIGDSIAEE